jgi:hypothetical protein
MQLPQIGQFQGCFLVPVSIFWQTSEGKGTKLYTCMYSMMRDIRIAYAEIPLVRSTVV